MIRALKRFISDSFENHSGYLRLLRHKRVPLFLKMGERFISEKLLKYMEAVEKLGVSTESVKDFILYLIKPEFMKKKIDGET